MPIAHLWGVAAACCIHIDPFEGTESSGKGQYGVRERPPHTPLSVILEAHHIPHSSHIRHPLRSAVLDLFTSVRSEVRVLSRPLEPDRRHQG
jgi:hypothetical protein